jgi:hypothetical protein
MGERIHNLGVLKYNFGEDDEAMFQGVERPCELIFCILGIKKSDLDNSLVIFNEGEWA